MSQGLSCILEIQQWTDEIHGGWCSIANLCLALCDSMACSMPGFPVLHSLSEFAQTLLHWVREAIQPAHPLSPPSLFKNYPLKLQYFGHLMRRVDSLEKTLMLGGIGGRRRRGRQMMRWLDGITDSMDISLSLGIGDGQGGLACCDSWGCKESDTTEQLNWLELNISKCTSS